MLTRVLQVEGLMVCPASRTSAALAFQARLLGPRAIVSRMWDVGCRVYTLTKDCSCTGVSAESLVLRVMRVYVSVQCSMLQQDSDRLGPNPSIKE